MINISQMKPLKTLPEGFRKAKEEKKKALNHFVFVFFYLSILLKSYLQKAIYFLSLTSFFGNNQTIFLEKNI
uniref:Uncharacterized protein n=1 Tax=Octopus bimaculoides TaxID=37653 RepID=A0A0L8FIZ6_OCTBM